VLSEVSSRLVARAARCSEFRQTNGNEMHSSGKNKLLDKKRGCSGGPLKEEDKGARGRGQE
jgi:hypothetical protein